MMVNKSIGLDDKFLHELVQELDHQDIVGIILGGSYAREVATLFSDIDLACFWREEVKPPPKHFLYRQDKLISVKMTTVSEIREMLKRPQSAILFANGKYRLLLDKDGSITRLLAEIEAFRWEDLQSIVNKNVSLFMMLIAENVQKVLREFEQDNILGMAFAVTKLVSELTLVTALCQGTLITSDSTYYQQVQEVAGLDSAWTRAHRIAIGLEASPTGIAPLRGRGIAVLHLYRETLEFAKPLMQTEHREIAEHILQMMQEAAE